MKYLLDTDVLSNLLRRAPSTALIAKLALVPPEEQCTSSVTIGELVYGAYHLSTRTEALLRSIDEVLIRNLPVVPFGIDAAKHYGRTRAMLEQQGMTVGEADLQIAAIALAGNMVVVSGNVRHFQRIPGLTVENWLDDN